MAKSGGLQNGDDAMMPLAMGMGGPQDAVLVVLFLLALVPTIFWIVELVDIIRRDFREPSTKLIWLLVVIFTHFIGALIYYFVGKPQGTLRT